MAQVIMIASGKGGTGKSTVASFLALELAFKGHKTFLTELDLGLRSIDVISGVSDKTVYDIGDVLESDCKTDKAIIVSPHSDKLHIMPAPCRKNNIKLNNLKKMIDKLYNDYEYIIIDTPAGLGDAFGAAINCATSAIIVATPDTVSVRDARIVSDEINNGGITDIKLIINKFDQNTFKYSGFEDMDQVIDMCCAQLLGIIPYNSDIQVAAMDGKVINKDCLTAKIFSAIANRLQGIHTPMNIR